MKIKIRKNLVQSLVNKYEKKVLAGIIDRDEVAGDVWAEWLGKLNYNECDLVVKDLISRGVCSLL